MRVLRDVAPPAVQPPLPTPAGGKVNHRPHPGLRATANSQIPYQPTASHRRERSTAALFQLVDRTGSPGADVVGGDGPPPPTTSGQPGGVARVPRTLSARGTAGCCGISYADLQCGAVSDCTITWSRERADSRAGRYAFVGATSPAGTARALTVVDVSGDSPSAVSLSSCQRIVTGDDAIETVRRIYEPVGCRSNPMPIDFCTVERHPSGPVNGEESASTLPRDPRHRPIDKFHEYS